MGINDKKDKEYNCPVFIALTKCLNTRLTKNLDMRWAPHIDFFIWFEMFTLTYNTNVHFNLENKTVESLYEEKWRAVSRCFPSAIPSSTEDREISGGTRAACSPCLADAFS